MVLPEIQTQNYRFIGDFNLDKYAFSRPMNIKKLRPGIPGLGNF
jgi:hypothetical protein